MQATHLSKAELFPIHTSEAHLESSNDVISCVRVHRTNVIFRMIREVNPFCSRNSIFFVSRGVQCGSSPPSRCGCCWPCELHPLLPDILRGAPAWKPDARSWTHCCIAVWQPHTFCRHSNGHPPAGSRAEGKKNKKIVSLKLLPG